MLVKKCAAATSASRPANTSAPRSNPSPVSVARQVIAVPKKELDKREAAYQRKKIAEKKRRAA
jgi:hypothetical protein